MPRKPKAKRDAPVAAVLSILVPGLGQIYAGKQERGAAILVAGIIVGTLALIWQTLFITAGTRTFFPYRIALTIYTLIFWAWQVVDAYKQAQ
jgi:TM2 domain-containing membrane protein YozV